MASLPLRDPIGDHLLAPQNASRSQPKVRGIDVALVRDGQIAVLQTLLTAAG